MRKLVIGDRVRCIHALTTPDNLWEFNVGELFTISGFSPGNWGYDFKEVDSLWYHPARYFEFYDDEFQRQVEAACNENCE